MRHLKDVYHGEKSFGEKLWKTNGENVTDKIIIEMHIYIKRYISFVESLKDRTA